MAAVQRVDQKKHGADCKNRGANALLLLSQLLLGKDLRLQIGFTAFQISLLMQPLQGDGGLLDRAGFLCRFGENQLQNEAANHHDQAQIYGDGNGGKGGGNGSSGEGLVTGAVDADTRDHQADSCQNYDAA